MAEHASRRWAGGRAFVLAALAIALVAGVADSRPAGAADVSYDRDTKKVTLKPTTGLARGSTYRATIRTVAKDEAGNALVRPRTWQVTVARR